MVMAAAISEPGQDITRPATVAARTESGWRINGRKIFCTMSPAASVLYTAVTFPDEDGGERYGYALIPTDAPGVTVHDDWDAMGMRASGSNSVTFDGRRAARCCSARRLPGRRPGALHGAEPRRRASSTRRRRWASPSPRTSTSPR